MAKDSVISPPAAPLLDDAALTERARSGDMAAFSRLVTACQDRVLNVCWRISGNLEDARDLTQETFLKAMKAIGSFQQRASFSTWVYRIAVNIAIAHRRKSARAVKLSLHGGNGEWTEDRQDGQIFGRVTSEPQDPLARMSAREMERLVMDGLEEIDPDHRAVLVLRDIEGLDYQQIAEVLELPMGTVKSRIHRARMELRECLRPVFEESGG